MLLDTLYTGCSIGAYSLIKKSSYPYTCRARTKIRILCLERTSLYEAVEYMEELNCALWDAEEFINNNGVPLCDYALHRKWSNGKLPPIEKFKNAVRRVRIIN